MKVRVLGSAAGGGLPAVELRLRQLPWRRDGRRRRARRAHAGVGRDQRRRRLLVPDQRVARDSRPDRVVPGAVAARRSGTRRSPALLLTNGDLDHCLGLLSLRESHPLVVYATEAVRAGFAEGNVLYRTLERFPGQVDLAARSSSGASSRSGDREAGLHVTAIAAPGKLPLHLEGLRRAARPRTTSASSSATSARAGGSRTSRAWRGRRPRSSARSAEADVVFFDGTFWSSDELIAAGLGTRRAEEMAHWPVGGPRGSLRVPVAARAGGGSTSTSTTPTRSSARTARSGRRSTPRGVEVAARRAGARPVSERAAARPTSSSRACARRGCAAITISTRSTS